MLGTLTFTLQTKVKIFGAPMKTDLVKKLKADLETNRKKFRSFITRQENKLKSEDIGLVKEAESYAWSKVDCLSCANCCKSMSPTYNKKDIERISAHLNMTPAQFKKKWLHYDKKGRDWVNNSVPCQFLDLQTNKCTIYSVRPDDCADFPHFTKRPFKEYFYIHKQNIDYCPATYKMIEKLQTLVKKER